MSVGLPSVCVREFAESLSGACRVVTVVDEQELATHLSGKSSTRLLLIHASQGEAVITRMCERMAATDPAAVVLVVHADETLAASSISSMANVRILPGPTKPRALALLARDYIEQLRSRQAEEWLADSLRKTRKELDELGSYIRQLELSGTTEVLRLHHVVAGLSGLHTAAEIGQFLVTTIAGLVRCRRVSMLMPDASGQHLTVIASAGIDQAVARNVRVPIGAPICGEVFAQSRTFMLREGRPLPAHWSDQADRELMPHPPLLSMVLLGAEHPVAVLNISEPMSSATFTEQMLTGLDAVAEAAGISLVNIIREQERNEARDKIMLALAKLAESRDPETGKHLERVQSYCRILAEELRQTTEYAATITPEFIRTLVHSSPLHDIGKVGVPDQVLLKPGRLTPEEFEIMKRHPIIGGDTIRSLADQDGRHDFLQMAMEIAYHHHEKFNGTGYPRGLRGDEIPLSARIIAVADVYDALTSARVYKAAMGHEQASRIILDESGKHFDPQVVQAFARREGEFAKLAQELADSSE